MTARIHVLLRPSILDAPGQAVRAALDRLGFPEVDEVRVGKVIEVRLSGLGREEAERRVDEMCRRLLANPVLEEYRIEWLGCASR